MLSAQTGGAYGQGWRTGYDTGRHDGYGRGYEHGLRDGLERAPYIEHAPRVRRPDEGGEE